MLCWEENHRFCNMTWGVVGKKIKGRGGGIKSKAVELYTPLDKTILSEKKRTRRGGKGVGG